MSRQVVEFLLLRRKYRSYHLLTNIKQSHNKYNKKAIKKEIIYSSGGLKNIFHEIGHTFQAEMEIFEKNEELLSKQVFVEKQCETMAYYLYNSIYKETPLNKKNFNTYFSIDDVRWLSDYYGDEVQDDILTNETKE